MSVSSIFDEYNLPRILTKEHEKPPVPQAQEKIEVSFSCEGLRTSDPGLQITSQIKLILENESGQRRYVGETEIVKKDSNPKYVGTFSSDYYFEVKQVLLIEIMIIRRQTWEVLDQVTTSLAAIVGNINRGLTFELISEGQPAGRLYIGAKKLKGSNSVARFNAHGKKLKNVNGWFHKNNPYLEVYRIQEGGEEDALVYKSEILEKEANPYWKLFEIPIRALSEHDKEMAIRFVVKSQRTSDEKLIGQAASTLKDLLMKKDTELPLTKPDKKKPKTRGILEFRKVEICEKPGLIDYLRAGLEMKLILAIDFTSSNKEYTCSDSLHVLRKHDKLNPYQKAFKEICDVFLHYNNDKRVALYGFGGKPPGRNNTSHAFPLNGSESSPWVHGINGLMDTYKKAVQEISLGGPTYFEPMMQVAIKMARIAKAQGSREYTVLMIMTDGLINDMDQTIEALVQAAQLPLSVIIVGVGDADLRDLEKFNSKEGIYSSAGNKVSRKIVQFMPFGRLDHEEELAQALLRPIPKEMLDYMEMMNIEPGRLPEDLTVLSPIKRQRDVNNNSINSPTDLNLEMTNEGSNVRGFEVSRSISGNLGIGGRVHSGIIKGNVLRETCDV